MLRPEPFCWLGSSRVLVFISLPTPLASYPWPKCYTSVSGEVLYILGVHGSVFSPFEETNGEEPGTVVSFEKGKGLKVATGDGYIYITRVQPPCKKEMDAGSYINGNSSVIGKILGV